jgi:ABC-type sugar transport system permease subunit
MKRMDEKGRRMLTSTHRRRPVLKLSLKQKEKWSGILLVLPAVLAISAVVVYPLVSGILNSLRDAHMMRLDSAAWNGFDNYVKLFRYPHFGVIVKNTVVYASSVTLGAGTIGLLLALSLSRQTRVNRILRGLFFIPWIMPGVVVGSIFFYIFNSLNGFVPLILMALGIIDEPVNFFTKPGVAMPAVIAATVWLATPFFTIFFLAGLRAIPEEIEDAVAIDGANGLQKFRFITLPFLTKIIVIASTFIFIWTVNYYDIIRTTTLGGPLNQTETFPLLAYRMMFDSLDVGLTSALGVVWLLALVVPIYVYLRRVRVFA